MKKQVPHTVQEKAKKCIHEFSCLKTGQCGECELCPVEYANGGEILFLKDRKYKVCPYRLPFGDRQICRCPVHYELHQQA